MQVTKYTDIALRVMMHLALVPGQRHTISDIAERYNLSRNHLVKVVHQLVLDDYLDSVQGRGGGICLARDASEINVGSVVRATEMRLKPIDCTGLDCPLRTKCILRDALDEAMDAFMAVLDSYTVQDLIRNKRQLLRLIKNAG